MTDQLIFVHDKRRDAYVDKTSEIVGLRPPRCKKKCTLRRGRGAGGLGEEGAIDAPIAWRTGPS